MFKSARLKVQRGNHHISDIERLFTDFVTTNPHKLIDETDPNDGSVTVRIEFDKEAPVDIALAKLALAIGDAIHNLRAALDHMTWELVGMHGGTQDHRLQFPSGRDRNEFEAHCKRIKT